MQRRLNFPKIIRS